MNRIQWITDVIIVGFLSTFLLLLLLGCTAFSAHDAEVGPTIEFDYQFCKSGSFGDYRVAIQVDKETQERIPVLFLFPVGGPYDIDHIICAISGDHQIADLGKRRAA